MTTLETTTTNQNIPQKKYFTIGEVSKLCEIKSHVLRYWEQEFTHIKPVKRKGNRRYYQKKDIITIQKIAHLLYERGYTIMGARKCLEEQKKQTTATNNKHQNGKQLNGAQLNGTETNIINHTTQTLTTPNNKDQKKQDIKQKHVLEQLKEVAELLE